MSVAMIIVMVVIVVFVGVAILAGLAAPALIRTRKKGDQIIAMNNGKSMALALNDFSAEYGSLPDRETAKQVAKNNGTVAAPGGDTANDYFRQLIAAKLVRSEDVFWAKTTYSPKKPDNNMAGENALEAGEVGFGYLMNGDHAIPDSNPELFVAVAPLVNPGDEGEFDPRPLDGKAAMVRLDTSVRLMTIGPDHKVVIANRKSLLEAGPDTIWGNDVKPVIKAPKTR